MANYLINIYTL